MQVQTAQQLWVMYLQLPQQEKNAFLAKVQTIENYIPANASKVSIAALRKKRNLHTAEEIDANIQNLREEWERDI